MLDDEWADDCHQQVNAHSWNQCSQVDRSPGRCSRSVRQTLAEFGGSRAIGRHSGSQQQLRGREGSKARQREERGL